MAYKIKFTPSAGKDYHFIQPAYLKPKIANALEEIALKPHQAGRRLKAKLSGYYYSVTQNINTPLFVGA